MKFASLLAFIPFFVHADDLDFGVARLQYSHLGTADYDDGGSMSYDRFLLQTPLNKPVALGNSLYFMSAFRYTLTQADFSDVKYDEIDDLHQIELPLTLFRSENGNPWTYNLQLTPGIASDFDDVTSDDLFLDAKAGATYAFSKSFSLNFGLAYTRVTGEPSVLPYLGFIWNPNEQWKLTLLGATFDARYKLSEDWIVRFTAQPGGGVWNVSSKGSGESSDLDLTSYQTGITIERRLQENLWIYAGAGLTFNNQTEIRNDGGHTIYDDEADSSSYFVVGLRLADW